MQLVKLFEHFQHEVIEAERSLELRLNDFEKKKRDLTIRLGLGEIDKETCELTLDHLTSEIQIIYKEINTCSGKISNLENLLEKSLEKLKKLSVLCGFSGLENKRKIQKILFPEGFYYDVENHEYLTKKINGFVLVTCEFSRKYVENKNGSFQYSTENSHFGTAYGNRTRDSSVKGMRLNPLTNAASWFGECKYRELC